MVKLRSAYYCNLKLLLIWLVIFAHWIEPLIWTDPVLYTAYRWIYLVHMPLFAFLSGLFLRNTAGGARQLKRTLPLYILCQAIAVLSGNARWDTPWWILWYLLSLSFWLLLSCFLMGLKRGKWLVFVLAIAAGCLAGNTSLGRTWSLSRTVVFFPYFWLGVMGNPDTQWHRLRIPGLAALLIVLTSSPKMSAVTLWHAGPCDPALRLQCYACGLLLGLFLLSWCPRRRFPWTRAGADTMPAYLLHGPIVGLLRQFPLPHPWLLTTFFLYIIHKAMQWHGVYGITGKEVCPWPDSRTCIKPTESRSTASSCR